MLIAQKLRVGRSLRRLEATVRAQWLTQLATLIAACAAQITNLFGLRGTA
jgi:hypothetical protein